MSFFQFTGSPGEGFISVTCFTGLLYSDVGTCFFTTKPATVQHNKLGTTYTVTDETENETFGRMSFIDYDQERNLPKEIQVTAAEINETTASKIERLLAEVLFNDFNETKDFEFSQN